MLRGALLCGLAIPPHCFNVASLNAAAIKKELSDTHLCTHKILKRRFQLPFKTFGKVLLHAPAFRVHKTESKLRYSVTLVGSFSQHAHYFSHIRGLLSGKCC